MKKLLAGALAVLATAVASSAPAATTTLAITHNGYVPKTLTIMTGDSVHFVNQDTATHQVVLRPRAGFTCTASLVIQPGESSTCTFRTTTNYTVRDPNFTRAAFRGTLRVRATPPTALSLNATANVVVYGGRPTLSGQLANGLAAQEVALLAQECGGPTVFARIASLTTTAGGGYTLSVQPRRNTTYQTRFKSSTSTQVVVKVRPKVTIRKLAPRRFRVTVLAAESYSGRFVLFQRFSPLRGRWITVRSAILRSAGVTALPINPTSVSRAIFRAKIKSRLRVRAVMTQAQAGSCYTASTSATIRS
jgi:plastocyanin